MVRTKRGVTVHATNACPSGSEISKLEDIVFTKASANWVHHPYEDALVVTAKIANNLIHIILVDNESAVNIPYWSAYQKTGLTRVDLSPTTLPLYRVRRGSRGPRRNYQAGSHPKRASPSGNDRDWIPHSKLLVSLQRSVGQTTITSRKNSDLDPLPNYEVPYCSGNRPNLRKTVGL